MMNEAGESGATWQGRTPVTISVVWDDDDIELRLIRAVVTLFEEAASDGLDESALARAARYLSSRFPSAG